MTHRLHTLQKLTDRVSQAAYWSDAGMPLSEGRCLAAIGAFAPLSVNDLAQRANLEQGPGQPRRAGAGGPGPGAQGGQRHRRARRRPDADSQGRAGVAARDGSDRAPQHEILACLDAEERRQLDRLLDRLIEAARAEVHGPIEGEE